MKKILSIILLLTLASCTAQAAIATLTFEPAVNITTKFINLEDVTSVDVRTFTVTSLDNGDIAVHIYINHDGEKIKYPIKNVLSSDQATIASVLAAESSEETKAKSICEPAIIAGDYDE